MAPSAQPAILPDFTPRTALTSLARDEAARAVAAHAATCLTANLQLEPRLRSVELKLAWLLGAMMGAGFLGGATATVLQKLIAP